MTKFQFSDTKQCDNKKKQQLQQGDYNAGTLKPNTNSDQNLTRI